MEEITRADSLHLELSKIRAATHNFAADRKLGQGGFGQVYKVPFCKITSTDFFFISFKLLTSNTRVLTRLNLVVCNSICNYRESLQMDKL